MLSLILRNLIFTILQPGVVIGLVPYVVLRLSGYQLIPGECTLRHLLAAAVAIVGLTIMLVCIVRFVTEGKGTISPLDPTKKLIVRGLYRYSRNPMYVGAMLVLGGQAMFWWSIELLVYAVAIFIAFNLFIILHEEPRLRREFGTEYDTYCRQVRRWI